MKYIEALCILVALGSALARPQSEGRASRLEDDWRPMSNYHYVRYLQNTTHNNMYNRIISAIDYYTHKNQSNSTESSVDGLESELISSMSEDLKQVSLLFRNLISMYINGENDFQKSQTKMDKSDLKLKNREEFGWLKLLMNSQFDETFILNKLKTMLLLFLSKSYSKTNEIGKQPSEGLYGNFGESSHFLEPDGALLESRRKRQVSSEETLDYDSEEDPDASSDSSSETSNPNELDLEELNEDESYDEDELEDSSVVTSGETDNDKKDMSDDDNVIVESFVSNSLSDLKSAPFELKTPAHKPSVIVNGHTDESLDDLILHHTGSSGVIHHHPPTKNHRPSVILVQDAPEHLLPKPPSNYRPTSTHHTTARPETSINNQNNNNYHNTVNRPQSNNVHSQGPSYKPVYHYPSTNYEPTPEPEYVPLPSPPRPPQSHKPVHHKPIYTFSTTEPSIITVEHLYRPLRPQSPTTTARPPTSTFRPVHDYHYPNYPSEPNFEPVPIYHPHKPQDIHRPIYKPVHHYPPPEHEPEPEPEPGPVPIYQGSHPSPQPQPEPEFVHHYADEPVYLISSSTQEPVPSPKPASPTQSAPIVQANTPLGPTLIFINQQIPSTSLPSPSPSPLNPVTISNGEPPPSIVLLPPLNDIPPTAQDAPPPAPHCAPVYISHTQNIHTSADFKDDCADVNIIINSPVAAAIGAGGGGGGGGEGEFGSEEEDEEQIVQQDDDPGGGGGGGGGGGLIIPAAVPIIAAAGAGGAAAAAAAGAAGTAGIVGGAVAGGTVTPRPNLPLQNAPARPTSSSSLIQQAPPTPTKRPESSMTLWDYLTSAFTSFAYPFWTIVFAPFSLLLASGLGVAALVFPWAFPRFWFGRGIRDSKRKRRRKRSSGSELEFAPMVAQLDFYAEMFERRLNSNFNFSRIFDR